MTEKIKNQASSGGTSGNNRGESMVADVGIRRRSCGYCRSGSHTSISQGLWAHSLTVDEYQALLDRGWRRSGCYLYKPEMDKTCCSSYTIRLKAKDFFPSKEQLRVSKRMQRFLDGDLDSRKSDEFKDGPKTSKDSCILSPNKKTSSPAMESFPNNGEKNKDEQFMHYLSGQIDCAVRVCIQSGHFPSNIQITNASVKKVSQAKRKLLVEGSEDLLYSSNFSFLIAASLKRSNKDARHLKSSGHITVENNQSNELSPKKIIEKMESYLKHLSEISGLSTRACNGHINFYSSTKEAYADDKIEKLAVYKESSTGKRGKGCCLKKIHG